MKANRWWFFDQAIVIAITGAVTFGIFSGVGGIARIVLVAPLVLFLPGYSFVSALFPDKPDDEYRSFDERKTGLNNPLLTSGGLESVERTILSVVFSVALVPTIALITALTPGGLTPEPILSGLAALTVGFAVVAIVTRYRCPPDRRFAPSLSSVTPFFVSSRSTPYDRTSRWPYNVGIAIGLMLLLASAGFAVANPPQHDGFTEFSVETEDVTGETDTVYESAYVAGENRELEVTITNRERGERTYTVVALLERVSYDGDDVAVHETDELDRETTTVADGATHRQSIDVTPTMEDEELRLTLLLYEGDPPAEPATENAYRAVHLPIEVT